MDDLAGLNFSSHPPIQPKSAPPNQTRFPQNNAPKYITPVSSSRAPTSSNYAIGNLRTTTSTINSATPKQATGAKTDSFASLSAFSGISRPSQSGNATLEQQRLAREKERREAAEAEQRKMDMHFGANEFWEKHSRQATPTITTTDTYQLPKEAKIDIRSGSVDLSGF